MVYVERQGNYNNIKKSLFWYFKDVYHAIRCLISFRCCILAYWFVQLYLISYCSLFCFIESPFEFRALEVALEAICSFLAARTTELETAAYPALDELTSKVCIFGIFLKSA